MSSRQERWLLLALFVIMAILQIALTRRQGLWADEIFSLAIATGHSLEHPAAAAQPQFGDFVEPSHAVPADEFRRYLKHDNPPASPARVIRAVLLSDTSPPLYYILLYGWTLIFHTSDFALRSFSIACSLACFPLLVAVARRTGGRGTVFAACLLFAFSPLGIYYSTEGRMYSLLWLCVLATAWISLVLHRRGGGIALYLLWIVASAAGFLTHYFFLFPWGAMVTFLAFQPRKFERRRLVLCIFFTGLAILPWYWMVPDSLSRWRVTQGWLKVRPAGFHRMGSLANQFLQFFSPAGSGLWRTPSWSTSTSLGLLTLASGAMALRLGWRMFTGRRLFLWLWFFAACVGPSVIDLLQHSYTANVSRYALAGLPAACLLVAIGLQYLGRALGFIVLLLVTVAWMPSLLNIYRQHSRSLEPFREVARAISDDSSASDVILVHSIPSGVLGIARYANGSAMIASWVGQLGTRRAPDSLPALIGGYAQVWLAKLHEVGQPAPEEEWLRSNGEVLAEKSIGAANIIRFTPKKAATF